MQSNKASKKTRKAGEEPAAGAPETGVPGKGLPSSRMPRSSNVEKIETSDLGSGMHRHKVGLSVPEEPAITGEIGIKSIPATARAATHDEIAKLAFSYWIARGCAHGAAEQDWLRAERELRGHRS